MMAEYLKAALKHLTIEELPEGEGFFVATDALPGVWGHGATIGDALADFAAGVEGWVALALQRGIEIPPIEGIKPTMQAA